MSIFENTKLQLFVLYICICLVLFLRISVESTGYMSPDSDFYTQTATNSLQGKGFVTPTTYPFDETSLESYTAIWPIGYPSLIAIVSYAVGIDTFISSKLVNIIFLGFIFVLLYYWYGDYSLLPACYFCSFNQLEIYSYTWSEGTFLFFLLWLLYLLEQVLSKESTYKHTVLLIVCLTAMTLLRYAGLIYFFYFSLFVLILLLKRKFVVARQLIVVISISSLLVISYLSINYVLSGGFFGNSPRIFPERESWPIFIKLFLDGFFNEIFIVRNFYWVWDSLFVLTLVVQFIVGYFVFRKTHLRLDLLQRVNHNHLVMISSGLFYLVFIIIIRKLSPFDAFDYRILAPFSTPIFIVILGNIRYHKIQNEINYIRMVIVGFFMMSLIMNLPKTFILKFIGIL